MKKIWLILSMVALLILSSSAVWAVNIATITFTDTYPPTAADNTHTGNLGTSVYKANSYGPEASVLSFNNLEFFPDSLSSQFYGALLTEPGSSTVSDVAFLWVVNGYATAYLFSEGYSASNGPWLIAGQVKTFDDVLAAYNNPGTIKMGSFDESSNGGYPIVLEFINGSTAKLDIIVHSAVPIPGSLMLLGSGLLGLGALRRFRRS